nr:MAG TPA: hypothetical protein [Caudoviricetes sp.]
MKSNPIPNWKRFGIFFSYFNVIVFTLKCVCL